MGFLKKFKKKIARKIAKEYFMEEMAFRRQSIEIDNASSGGGGSTLISLSKRVGIRFGDITSNDYEEAEYDLLEIDKAYDGDSYARQGIDKYLEQIFKEGYRFYSKNPSALEYIKARLVYISASSQIPTDQLINEIAEDVVKYSNSIIAKSRKIDETQLPPSQTVTGLDGQEPVVAYFPLHPGTFQCKRDKNGLVKGWQQEVEGADKPVKFKPQDIIHIPYKRRRGHAFGTPFLIPVLDDIKALRFLEENVINMVYKHINPLIHAKVGDDESPGTKEEIDDVTEKMDNMDAESGIVTSNRVDILGVNADVGIDARPYLDYSEQRVFSGLGVPGIKFGRGGTANRNTADSMTDEMSDRIKAFQVTISSHINEQIIKELLLEGGFVPTENPDDMVYFEFIENDLDRKIKSETHFVYLFENNAIDENEMRDGIGREPITERGLTHFELYTLRQAEMKSASTGQSASGSSSTSNKQKPTNQHGTKTSPKKNTNELYSAILEKDYSYISKKYCVDEGSVKTILNCVGKDTSNPILKEITVKRVLCQIEALKNISEVQ